MQKILKISQPDTQLQISLAEELGISPILTQVLINRGINSASEAEKFLQPSLADLLPPLQMKDMEAALKRITRAARLKEKAMIFGDYDVDGITSVALLKTQLERLGINTVHYIPHRVNEGYGLNLTAGKIAKKNGIKLIITVDCGINSCLEIERFRRWGIDVIVTDHHEPQGQMPKACAILNPKRRDCSYQYKELSGVGVAFKLAQAVTKSNLWEDLDLVALGTIADSVALNGENRIIVREGLKRIPASSRPGIQALMDVSGINKQKPLKASAVSFILGPRINASGRVDTAESALRLLLCQSSAEACDLAKALNAYNRRRQKIEEAIFREAQNLIDKEINFKEHSVIVLSGQNWHPGVLGIVASRIMYKFYRPTILISECGHGTCRGSARSIKDFSIFDALLHCQKHLNTFGGHKLAAGLTIEKDNIHGFRQDINSFARQILLKEFLLPSIEADMEINLSDLNKDLIHQLRKMEPFGSANPEPAFYTRNLTLRSEPEVLNRDTLKFWVTDSEFTYPVIGFGFGGLKQKLMESPCFALVYSPGIDAWRGNEDIILEAKEIIFR
ncbi:MAG: single-stranded-DNA-specific exonuclease RecJ [Candidatus Omnitrophota bacterium]